MFHNLPLLPSQAKLSLIQTNLPACSGTICGQNLELCALPASFQAIIFVNMLMKGVPQQQIDFLKRLTG